MYRIGTGDSDEPTAARADTQPGRRPGLSSLVDSTAPWSPPAAPERRSRRLWLWLLIAALVLFGGCATFVSVNTRARNTVIAYAHGATKVYYIPSESMGPAIPRGSRVAASTHVGRIRRGDVVIFRSPPGVDPSVKVLIKRVVGLPREAVATKDGHVLIDGKPLAEPYLAPGTETTNFTTRQLGAHEYFLMGDARPMSEDSRIFGPIARSDIVSVVVRVLSPPSAAGRVPGSSR
jgi:signal peptidase I